MIQKKADCEHKNVIKYLLTEADLDDFETRRFPRDHRSIFERAVEQRFTSPAATQRIKYDGNWCSEMLEQANPWQDEGHRSTIDASSISTNYMRKGAHFNIPDQLANCENCSTSVFKQSSVSVILSGFLVQ